MTRKIDEYSNEVWDHLFDFVAQPLEEMTIDEVQAELKNSGIDTTEAMVRVREAVATAKARVELERPEVVKIPRG